MPNELSQSNSPSAWCAYSELLFSKFFISELEGGSAAPTPPPPPFS